jgi:hypothetical protein
MAEDRLHFGRPTPSAASRIDAGGTDFSPAEMMTVPVRQ